MSKIKVVLDGEEEILSEFNYREEIKIEVEQDEENETQLKIISNKGYFFIKKEDLSELCHIFKI